MVENTLFRGTQVETYDLPDRDINFTSGSITFDLSSIVPDYQSKTKDDFLIFMNWAWVSGGYTYAFSQTITSYVPSTGILTVAVTRNANGMPERSYRIYDVLIVM